jgi:DNA-binding MarR family transcriptional regulator
VYADISLRTTAPAAGKMRVIVADQIDIREIAGCTCLRARRATRQLTQIYDAALEPVRLTINQFGVLAHLYGSTLDGRHRLSIGTLADLVGKHPSTLNRELKPLKARGLVADVDDPTDRRVRAVQIASKGRAQLRKAVPCWRRAEAEVRGALGVETTLALNGLLELTSIRLAK